MSAMSQLIQKGDNLFVPEMATIRRSRQLTELERLLEIELPGKRELGHKAGQFVQIGIFGRGESPISICSSPAKRGSFELCVRKMGNVTGGLHSLTEGSKVGIRGPFGNGYPMEMMQGKDCLVVAGGIGLAPLRSVINSILAERDRYGKLFVLYGTKSPSEMLFTDELKAWGKDKRNHIFVTVDKGDDNWKGNVGVVTTLFPIPDLDPANTIVSLVGPPVMYRFVMMELRAMQIPEGNIFASLERRMKCGLGKCGNCQVNNKCVCVDGPVFSGTEMLEMWEAI